LCPHSSPQMESKCECGSGLSSFLLTDGIEVRVRECFGPHSSSQMESKCQWGKVLCPHSSSQMESKCECGRVMSSLLLQMNRSARGGVVVSSFLLTDDFEVRGWECGVLVPPHRYYRSVSVAVFLSSLLLTDGIEVRVRKCFRPHSYSQMEWKCEGGRVLCPHFSSQMESRCECGRVFALLPPTNAS
jgi:hypothetical protein